MFSLQYIYLILLRFKTLSFWKRRPMYQLLAVRELRFLHISSLKPFHKNMTEEKVRRRFLSFANLFGKYKKQGKYSINKYRVHAGRQLQGLQLFKLANHS